MFSTTFGVGDGTTTFNLPDLRGRVIAGKDDMGGSSANRLTDVTGSLNGDTLGDTGGAETFTLVRSDLPNESASVTITDPGHGHPGSTGQLASTGSGGGTYIGGFQGAGSFSTPLSIASNTTGITAALNLNGGVSQTAPALIQPTIIGNYLMRVI